MKTTNIFNIFIVSFYFYILNQFPKHVKNNRVRWEQFLSSQFYLPSRFVIVPTVKVRLGQEASFHRREALVQLLLSSCPRVVQSFERKHERDRCNWRVLIERFTPRWKIFARKKITQFTSNYFCDKKSYPPPEMVKGCRAFTEGKGDLVNFSLERGVGGSA